MERPSDPGAAPAYVLNTLHDAGYEPYAVDDGHSLYRLPGGIPRTWRECMEEVGADNARLREDNTNLKAALTATQRMLARVAGENDAMRAKAKSRLGEFLLTTTTVVPLSALAVGAGIAEQLGTVLPPPYGHIVAVIGAGLAAKITHGYVQNRPTLPEGKKDDP